MNLPNKLTVSRFVLTALFLWAMFWHSSFNDTVALVFFCAASITDFLDGQIARRRGIITNFGKLMDPLADKIMVCSAFIALIERSRLNASPPVTVEAWMVIIIVARELAITGLRLLAASKNVVLAAERYGKNKTISQVVAIISLLVINAYEEWWPWLQGLFQSWAPVFAELALWVAVILTAVSGCLYLWRNRVIYIHDV